MSTSATRRSARLRGPSATPTGGDASAGRHGQQTPLRRAQLEIMVASAPQRIVRLRLEQYNSLMAQFHAGPPPYSPYLCHDCNVYCNGLEQLQIHLAGRRHQRWISGHKRTSDGSVVTFLTRPPVDSRRGHRQTLTDSQVFTRLLDYFREDPEDVGTTDDKHHKADAS